MKLLSPTTGWVGGGTSLSWTTDGGDDWTDIMPVPSGAANIASVFFRDTSEGWALLSWPEPVPQGASARALYNSYSIAHTDSSGRRWSFTAPALPTMPEWMQDAFAGYGGLYFVDSLHGWMGAVFAGNARPGKLLATEDGGQTWNWVNSPGVSGQFTFATPQDGWLVSSTGEDRIWVTHDGCKTWNEVSLPPVARLGATGDITFQGPPVFQNPRKGYLVVYYGGAAATDSSHGAPSRVVVYSNTDVGRTWQPVKVMSVARDNPGAEGIAFAIMDSTIVVSTGMSTTEASIAEVPLNGGFADVKTSDYGINELTFADANNGWVWTQQGGFLATHDGGARWRKITPNRRGALQDTDSPVLLAGGRSYGR
jgi:photosystem II stability/assembly factor-like uncharacterized protein